MMEHRPTILYVVSHCPHGRAYGARLRTLHVGRALARIGEVTMLPVELWPWDDAGRAAAAREFNIVEPIRPRQIGAGGAFGRARRELDPSHLNTHGFVPSGADRDRAIELIKSHDLAWVHTVRTANATGVGRWPFGVLDIDDLPSAVYEPAPGMVARALAPVRRLQWRRREGRLLGRFDRLVVCSQPDRAAFADSPRVAAVPNGFDRLPERSYAPADPPRLGFIGTMEYAPNRDAISWFVREVWPIIRDKNPVVTLRLVGSLPGVPPITAPGVEWLGFVDNPADEIASWSAMVVPIRSGGGTRVKIAEAFSRRCPVVSTTLGAFGYPVTDGVELMLADNAEATASACLRIVDDPAFARALTDRAHDLFERRCTWDAAAGVVETVVRSVLEPRATPTPETVRQSLRNSDAPAGVRSA